MRTNIDLDDALVAEAMELTSEPTKTAVIHRALRELIRIEGLKRIREHRGKLTWEGDLQQWRGRPPAMVRETRATYGTARRHKRPR